ncbi:MAG: CRISPR-associated helicase Cas3' [Clostridiales bacterium]|nr:CRISPR-associated helicase Cas3' [Clostridiales bacterium]
MKEDQFPAHIRRETCSDGRQVEITQTVKAHLEGTANYAAQALAPVGLSQSARLAGLLHDCGKLTQAYKSYLIRSVHGEPVHRGSVNHTFAGVRLLLERYHRDELDLPDIACEVLALAVGGHHGWFDCVDEHQKSGFRHRLAKTDIGYEEARENYFRFVMPPAELDRLFETASAELCPALECICNMTGNDVPDAQYNAETSFYAGLLARLMLSAVVEGDRRDTAEFMQAVSLPPRRTDEELRSLWAGRLARVEQKLNGLPHTSEIDRARREISDRCKAGATLPSGVFRLNAPTGGGKTLSSLRFALAHAQATGKRRILFVSPLLTILDQNAKVIRDYIQDDRLILEHHSNLVREEATSDQLNEKELLTENWDAPVIITTLVQLLNTLFSGKMSAVRRFQALCGSVIVIDEVQTVPVKLLSLFSLAVNFLAEFCQATVVLCSATQPTIEQTAHPLHGPVRELLPYDPALWAVFRRTELRDGGSASLEEIAALSQELLEEADSLLVVCNKKDEAQSLFYSLKNFGGTCCHLSAAMCPAHRRDVLQTLDASLAPDAKGKTLCVATQVVEAGVDISFERCLRLAAGMDSAVQTAGRCNRNGEAGPGVVAPVLVVQCKGEKLGRLPDIQRGKDATLGLFHAFRQRPERFGNDLASDASIQYYYQQLYARMPVGTQDGPVAVKDQTFTLFSLLSQNESLLPDEKLPYYFQQAFRLAGSLFQVFDEDSIDVIVPYGKGKELIGKLNSSRAQHDLAYAKELLQQAKPYSVSLYRYQIDQLEREGGLLPLSSGATALIGHYNEQTGFTLEEQPGAMPYLGVE